MKPALLNSDHVSNKFGNNEHNMEIFIVRLYEKLLATFKKCKKFERFQQSRNKLLLQTIVRTIKLIVSQRKTLSKKFQLKKVFSFFGSLRINIEVYKKSLQKHVNNFRKD